MKAIWNGAVIAQSDDTVLVDNNHYFPDGSIDRQYLLPSTTTSVCGWKGTANYFSIIVDGRENRDAAWCYAEPKDAAAQVRGRVAFWRGVEVLP
jgi:uncharacterized protein (DUF427 family)